MQKIIRHKRLLNHSCQPYGFSYQIKPEFLLNIRSLEQEQDREFKGFPSCEANPHLGDE